MDSTTILVRAPSIARTPDARWTFAPPQQAHPLWIPQFQPAVEGSFLFAATADPYHAAARAIDLLEHFEPQGHGSRIDKGAREAAREFVESLRALSIPLPDVGPSPDGGVGMSWAFSTSEGELEIDVVFLHGRQGMEYREGYAERDGFVEDSVLKNDRELSARLLRAVSIAQPQ